MTGTLLQATQKAGIGPKIGRLLKNPRALAIPNTPPTEKSYRVDLVGHGGRLVATSIQSMTPEVAKLKNGSLVRTPKACYMMRVTERKKTFRKHLTV
jgi:hypothetical protein